LSNNFVSERHVAENFKEVECKHYVTYKKIFLFTIKMAGVRHSRRNRNSFWREAKETRDLGKKVRWMLPPIFIEDEYLRESSMLPVNGQEHTQKDPTQ